MAEYLPPTETLPKFNEFVFDDAYSIEGIDRRAVHKAGTETITGVKTITGNFYINNLITDILSGTNTIRSATGTNTITSAKTGVADANLLSATGTGGINRLTSAFNQSGYGNVIEITTALGSNKMTTSGGDNYISTSSGNNQFNNLTGVNVLRVTTGQNLIENTGGSNVLEALTTGTNTIRSATGTNTITSAKTTTGANVIEATGAAGGNNITTASGRNLIEAGGGGVNLIQSIGGTTARNDIYSSGTATNANQLFAENGGNLIRASTGNVINTVSGSNRNQINGTDKIVVNSTDTAITNTTITINGTTNVNGYLTNTSAGGGGISMVGSGSGGLYTNYYPDGTGAGRKLYLGFPNTASQDFQMVNQYGASSDITLSCGRNVSINCSQIRKDGFDYPNIQVQWQSYTVINALSPTYFEMSNCAAGPNISMGETTYIKFPFQVRLNYILISFSAISYNNFISRGLDFRFITIGGGIYSAGSTGAILVNADRAQYVTTNLTLPANTEIRPVFAYTGTATGGTITGKPFSANFNFTLFN